MRNEVEKQIRLTLEEMQCPPVLFIGSGVSRRYFGSPDWSGLLEKLAGNQRAISRPYAYYLQSLREFPQIATQLADEYFAWAWDSLEENYFPRHYFENNVGKEIFLKHVCCEYIKSITPHKPLAGNGEGYHDEMISLSKIKAAYVITTNFDNFLELIFESYSPVVGNAVIKHDPSAIGHILHIHGHVDEPESLVLTKKDFEDYSRRQKYLSAKMLTLFTEYPVFVFGYSVNDENIKELLADIDEIITTDGAKVGNIFFVEWDERVVNGEEILFEARIPTSGTSSVAVHGIRTSEFSWLYDIIGEVTPLAVRVDVLRTLNQRMSKIIRKDIPSGVMQVNFEAVEQLVDLADDKILNVFGIARLDDPALFNINFPFSPGSLAERLGFSHWSELNKLVEIVKQKTGVDIRDSDNRYHNRVRSGKNNFIRKYSNAALELLTKVKNGLEYELEL